MMHKIEFLLKHNAFLQKAYIFLFSSFFRFLGLFIKPRKNRVLIQSLIGKSFGDSPRVLFEAMRKDPFFSSYKFVWAFDDPDSFAVEGAEKIKLNSFQYFLTALRSGIWITNVNIERSLHFKPAKTIYLNTWHGCAPTKVDGNAQKNRNDYDFSNIDIFCSNSEWQDGIFVRYYRAKMESIIRCGMPRNDDLYQVSREEIQSLREKYEIPEGKKVILYAPTWRENADGDRRFSAPINIRYWEEKLSDQYVFLIRMHHLAQESLHIEYNSFVRNCSGPYSINELLKISDILITDYSSVLTDFAILERPVLFFAYDYEAYKESRGLYMDLEDLLPGCVFRTEEDLIEHVLHMDEEEEVGKIKKLKERFVFPDNNSTEICLNALKNKINQQN